MESWPRAINENSNHTFVTNDKKEHDKGELDHRRQPHDLYSPHLGQEMESWPHTINENSNQSLFKYGVETSDTRKISHQGQDQNQTHHRSVRGLTSFPSFGERGSTPHNDPSYCSEFNNFRANSGKNQLGSNFFLDMGNQIGDLKIDVKRLQGWIDLGGIFGPQQQAKSVFIIL